MWDKIKPSTVSLEPNQCQNIVGVDGHSIQVRGSVKIPVTISNRTFEQTFIIADKITAEGILGMDFLEGNKCVFDVAKREITFEHLEPLSLVPPAPSLTAAVSNVALDKTITIPAACEIETMAKLPSAGGLWLVEGKKRSDVLVARAVVTPLRNGIPIRIVNTTTTPITLYHGTNVATAKLIEEVSVCGIGEISSPDRSQQVAHDKKRMDEITIQALLPAELTELQREKFLALLSHYADVMAMDNDDLGRTNILSHRIETNGARPIRQQARRVPLPHRERIQELLKDILRKEVISPSTSPWASPIVLVKKKDGSTRFCVDYRKVNEVTRKDAYPIPRVDDTLDTLAGSTWFTTLDLKSGYWQVEVAGEHREKTAFCTQEGLFEFNVMPFGLCNAPATFQRLMNSVLAGLQWTSCLVYIDDIIVVGRNFDEHLDNLQKVLKRLT